MNNKRATSILLSLILFLPASLVLAAGAEEASGPTSLSIWVLAGVQTDM